MIEIVVIVVVVVVIVVVGVEGVEDRATYVGRVVGDVFVVVVVTVV